MPKSSRYESLKSSYSDVLRLLSNMIEMRQYSSKGCSSDISEYCKNIAIKMDMSEEESNYLSVAGLLRDIGKVSISDDLLNIPYKELNDEQKKKVKNYPVVGEALLQEIESLAEPAKFIRSFKERYDGEGYPEGLSGEDIPLGSRILAVVNDYYALQDGNLVIGENFTTDKAIEYLDERAGKAYDPNVLSTFKQLLGHGEEETEKAQEEALKVSASDLENGMVLAQDIVTSMGVILLNKGKTVRKFTIMHLQNLEKTLSEEFDIYIQK